MKQKNFLLKYIRPYKTKFILLFLSIIISQIIVAFYPYIFGKLVDEVFYKKSMRSFASIVIFYAVIYFINQVIHYYLDLIKASLENTFLFDIKRDIYKKVLSLKGDKLVSIRSGDVLYRMNHDAEYIMRFLYSDIFYGIAAFIELLTYIGIIAYMNIWIAGIVVVLAFITFLFSKYFVGKTKPIYAKIAKVTASNEAWIFEVIRGMRDIRLLSAMQNCMGIFLKKNILLSRRIVDKTKYEVASERGNAGIHMISTLVIYGVSIWFISRDLLTLGGLIACTDYFKRVVIMFQRLNVKLLDLSQVSVALERIMDVFEEESEDFNGERGKKTKINGTIRFENVSFTYGEGSKVLNGVSFQMNAGETVALVGGSGAGKSTLVNLLYRLFDPDEGKIKIDNVDINEYNLFYLRENLGIVHQDSMIFDGTIRYNLIFSDRKEEDDKVWDALHRVNLGSFIRSLPDGLDTNLGYDGISLSGGQKQRLAIARLFIKSPRVIIFDEATSSLDNTNERMLMAEMRKLFPDRTIVIVAHRLSTIIHSDKVACLKEGKIVGFGRHDTLLTSCSPYQTLFREQYSKGE